MAGWNAYTAAGPLGARTVTLVEGSSFYISSYFFGERGYPSGTPAWGVPREHPHPVALEPDRQRPAAGAAGGEDQPDFADLFEVKEARINRRRDDSRQPEGDPLTIRAAGRDIRKGVVVNASGAEVAPTARTYRALVPAPGEWNTALSVVPSGEGTGYAPPIDRPDAGRMSPRDLRRQEWVAKIPVLQMGNSSIERTLRRSYDDLGTLQTLADRQGQVVDRMSEEEPGKTLHEVRLDVSIGLALGGLSAYYGSVDATPLVVALRAEVSRRGFAADTIAALMPHADRAMDWIQNFGDGDGINFADGTLAEPPIALAQDKPPASTLTNPCPAPRHARRRPGQPPPPSAGARPWATDLMAQAKRCRKT